MAKCLGSLGRTTSILRSDCVLSALPKSGEKGVGVPWGGISQFCPGVLKAPLLPHITEKPTTGIWV